MPWYDLLLCKPSQAMCCYGGWILFVIGYSGLQVYKAFEEQYPARPLYLQLPVTGEESQFYA